MAQVKLTAVRGKPNLKDVAIAAGTPIAGSDAIELNIDATKMTRADAIILVQAIAAKLFASKWPLV